MRCLRRRLPKPMEPAGCHGLLVKPCAVAAGTDCEQSVAPANTEGRPGLSPSLIGTALLTLALSAAWASAAVAAAAPAPLPEAASAQAGGAEVVDVRRIWDAAPHNAFTDLIRHKEEWLCVFREGTGHVSHDGKIRVIASADGTAWASAALVETPDAGVPDLRDPKICHTPDGRLMLIAGAANRKPGEQKHRTYVWFSSDGRQWGDATPVADENVWLWRVTWHKGKAYGVGYGREGAERIARLYTSDDGRTFRALVPRLFEAGYPNEATLRFLPDDTCLCLLRRDGSPNSAQLMVAEPPYESWAWKDLGVRVGGPNFLRLADGRLVAVTRRYDGGVRTSLQWLDPAKGTLSEFLRLPSGGDTSYAGLAWHDGVLWISYYSSHEKKTGIYLARVRLPAPAGGGDRKDLPEHAALHGKSPKTPLP